VCISLSAEGLGFWLCAVVSMPIIHVHASFSWGVGNGRKGAALWKKSRARLTVRLDRVFVVPRHNCSVFLTRVERLKVNRKYRVRSIPIHYEHTPR
jgi:hypothetical protein